MTLDISKIRVEVEQRLRARGLPVPAWSGEKWIEEASVDLRSRYLRGTNLRGANLAGADLHDVDLAETDLSDANLSGANLRGANLSRANFDGTDVTGMNVISANLERAKNIEKAKGRCSWAAAENIKGTVLGFAKVHSAYMKYERIAKENRRHGFIGDEISLRREANIPWLEIVTDSEPLIQYIMEKLVIPKGKEKAFELAARLINTSRKMPRNVLHWWRDNEQKIALILSGYIEWPEKAEGTAALFKLGPFAVHNTINLKGAKLNQMKEALETATATLEKNCIPNLDKTLYGDVYFIAQIQEAKTLAWYNSNTDKVYLRPAKNDKWNELESIIHELGHRFWRKIASKQKKEAWVAWYEKQKNTKSRIPQQGDVYQGFNLTGNTYGRGLTTITVKFVGFDENRTPIILCSLATETEVLNNRTYPWDGSTKEWWQAIQNFPSLYASQNAEECFCETLAYFAMGLLPEKFVIPFQAIWGAE